MGRRIAGRSLFRVVEEEHIQVRVGAMPDLMDEDRWLDYVLTFGTDEAGDPRPEADRLAGQSHPLVASLFFDSLLIPELLMLLSVSVAPEWRRRGLAEWMIQGAIETFGWPRVIQADARRDNTQDGNAFIDAWNKRHPFIPISFQKGMGGYEAFKDEDWGILAHRFQPLDGRLPQRAPTW